jgi:hypothetical protein
MTVIGDSLKQQQKLDSLSRVSFQNAFETVEPESTYVDSLNQIDALEDAKQEAIAKKDSTIAADALRLLEQKKKTTTGEKADTEDDVGVSLIATAAPFLVKGGYDILKNKYEFSGYGNLSLRGATHIAAVRVAMHGRKIALNAVDTWNRENHQYDITGAGRDVAGIGGSALGMGAAYTTAWGVKALHDAIDIGRRSEIYHQVADVTVDELQKNIIKKKTEQKIAQKAAGLGAKNVKSVTLSKVENKVIKDLALAEAKKGKDKVLREVAENLGKNMTQSGKNNWDEVSEKLLKNKKTRNKVAKWLWSNGYKKTVLKMGGALTAALIPEPVSTAFGVGAFLLLAYDVYTLAAGAKDLMDILLEEDTTVKDKQKPIEKKVIQSIAE